MKNWIDLIFKRSRKGSMPMEMPKMSPSQVEAMIQMIGKTQEEDLTCDEVHSLLGQFAEMALRGEDTANLLPLVHHHLESCPDCREEYEALMQILRAQVE